jgi:Arc/MetJ family transcription regulator
VRTNIVLDDKLVREAFRFSGARTKRELVDQALREFVQRHKRREMLELFGSDGIREDYDHKSLRAGG